MIKKWLNYIQLCLSLHWKVAHHCYTCTCLKLKRGITSNCWLKAATGCAESSVVCIFLKTFKTFLKILYYSKWHHSFPLTLSYAKHSQLCLLKDFMPIIFWKLHLNSAANRTSILCSFHQRKSYPIRHYFSTNSLLFLIKWLNGNYDL